MDMADNEPIAAENPNLHDAVFSLSELFDVLKEEIRFPDKCSAIDDDPLCFNPLCERNGCMFDKCERAKRVLKYFGAEV